ncbi:MAG: SDR family NAD(P)-dependent oxidoreductase [SAR324 cluster bacterium]|nr:SDR family NAD(P)-dependent oxidoreductase [SAR324 cluster bacterium]
MTCLIAGETGALISSLAQSLIEKGWHVIVLTLPSSKEHSPRYFSEAVHHIQLRDSKESTLTETLSDLTQQNLIDGIIYCASLPDHTNLSTSSLWKTTNNDLKQAFLLGKHLSSSLNDREKENRSFFVTVTQMDGELGTCASNDVNVFQGGFLGLTKTLSLEWEHVLCRAIDFQQSISAEAAVQSIFKEIQAPDFKLVEVGYSQKGRMTLVPAICPTLQTSEKKTPISSNNVFLVSGGARGVTADCIIGMAEIFSCRFILLGRSVYLPADPEWATGCEDEAELKKKIVLHLKNEGRMPTPSEVNRQFRTVVSSREIRMTLSHLEKAGGRAEYVQANITEGNLSEKIASAISKLGTISGIIHGAGVLADKPIEKKKLEDLDHVFSTKIDGLQHLLQAVPQQQLDYLILFSSASGFYGNAGQSDYSAANEILNKIAWQVKRRSPQCHVVSFNWGPWDGGMVTPELKKLFQAKNIPLLSIEDGKNIFIEALHPSRQGKPQLLVGSPMPPVEGKLTQSLDSFTIQITLNIQNNVFFEDHTIGKNPVLPAACAISQMAHQCELLYPAYQFVRCDDFQVLKGIVFEKGSPVSYTMEIEEISKSKGGQVLLEVRISGQGKGKLPLPHYTAKILLQKEGLGKAVRTIIIQDDQSVDGKEFYQNGTLFHGPAFQGIEKQMKFSETSLLLKCKLPTFHQETRQQFGNTPFEPLALDYAFQAMLIWARKYYGCGSLPLKMQQMKHFRPIQDGDSFYLSLEVTDAGKRGLKADLFLHDEEGQMFSQLSGVEVTVSETLNALFQTP